METPQSESRPRLLFFYSEKDGLARKIEGYLAQVLQRRQNHNTFVIHQIEMNAHPDLVERFQIETGPSFVVVEDKTVKARHMNPKNARDITRFLEPWLRK